MWTCKFARMQILYKDSFSTAMNIFLLISNTATKLNTYKHIHVKHVCKKYFLRYVAAF